MEEEDERTGRIKRTVPTEGTPQGGVISPLLSNIYLNYFDRRFHRDNDSPLRTANAKLVRYADDFVILAKDLKQEVVDWIEEKLEGRLQLRINREKTQILDLNNPGEQLNFLGYTFRKDKDLKGGDHRYLNIFPSEKAQLKIRERVREVLRSNCCNTFSEMIKELNETLIGWCGYFSYGYPRKAFRKLNWYLLLAITGFLRNRSQRINTPFRRGETVYAGVRRYGLKYC